MLEYFFDFNEIRAPQKYPGKVGYKGKNKGKYTGNPKGKNPSDVWIFPNVKSMHKEKTIHPCQFPIELAERLVLSMSKKNDLVIDPYAGVGTTLIAALKNKNKILISTLRLILTAIKEKDIANRSGTNKEGIKDPEIIKVLRKMKKQRQDSADLYQKGGRQELQEAENEEIKIIETFLPKQLSEEETKKVCKEMIESLKATSIKDMGKIMGTLKQKYSDSINFSKANVIVKGLLNQ